MIDVETYWSDVHNCSLTTTITAERFKRDKDLLKKESDNAEQGYKQYKYVWSVHFPRTSWIILRNSYYHTAINALKRGKGPLYEKYFKAYKSGPTNVPFCYVMKNGKKIGNFFLREDINGEEFLFMPKNGGTHSSILHSLPVSIGRDGKKYWKSSVSNDYYLFDLHSNGNIKPKSKLWYRKRS